MTFIVLITGIVILAVLAYYFFILAPKLHPANRAAEFLKNGRIDDAIDEYKKILDENPFDFETHYNLAMLFLELNDADQAAIHLQKILDIGRYNHIIEKINVQKMLAKIFEQRDEQENAFALYYDIVRMYPGDIEALYNTAFITLGQSEFDIAQRYFDKLVKLKETGFDVMYGAGICSYMNQKFNESVEYFKTAVLSRPESELANISMILALLKKRDFRTSLAFSNKLIGLSQDVNVKFIALRSAAFSEVLMKHFPEGVKKFEEVLEFSRSHELQDEIVLTLYDIAFACIKAEMSKRAYDYWNELFSLNRNFRNTADLIMTLRKDMETGNKEKNTLQWDAINDKCEEWMRSPYPDDFLWGICSLKASNMFDVKKYVVSTKITSENDSDYSDMGYSKNLIERLISLDTENFRIIANRVSEKMGYRVDQIMPSYRESDGVDLLTTKKDTKEKAVVWLRRWKGTKVGEIPLRNFAQQINDVKAASGVFVTTTPLTVEAEKTVQSLSKVKVVLPEELNSYLSGLL
jgi:tetratricopeptide (TPR) repeat protein